MIRVKKEMAVSCRRTCLPTLTAFALVALVALAGCGSGGSTSTSVLAGTPVAPGQSAGSSGPAVASVAGAPITKPSYDHWLAVEKALGASGDVSHKALGFLITSQWVLSEAAAKHVSVSDAQVRARFATLQKQSFPKAGSLQAYLSKSGETMSDLLGRVKDELLESLIAQRVTAGKSGSARSATLTSFQHSFESHWKRLTTCQPGYVMEYCSEYHGKPEPGLTSTTTSASSSRATGKGSSSSSSPGSRSPSSSSGEVYSAPGAFAISSSAFERNGAIPAEYTCAGKGISPPLSWEKVPSGAAELVLFVIDDTSSGSTGGIRWIVAGIDPSSKGVAAGQMPSGGIVGTNTAGKAAYSAICPAHGKSDTIEFVMYALKKKISLSPGFQPAVAEHDYGAGKLLLGQAAVTYAVASH